MTIYNFNLAMGWASSGVEYAQAYRENVFKKMAIDNKFVFTELILNGNIFDMAAQMGMSIDNVLPIHFFFTDIMPAKSAYTIKQLEEETNLDVTTKKLMPDRVTYKDGDTLIRANFDRIHGNVDFVDYVINGYLVRKDHYTNIKTFSEYYVPVNNQAEVYRRAFYNKNGQIAYEQFIENEQVIYRLGALILYSEFEFVDYFMTQLSLTSKDILIIDREKYIATAVLNNKGQAKVGVVIHAEHFSSNQTDKRHIVWNNFYEYQFTNANVIDFFVTATQKQKEVLAKQFKLYKGINPKIYAIPVGSLDKLRGKRHKRDTKHLMTASRLAEEKHVDWIIEAVIKVHQKTSSIQLDIFGTGASMPKLQKMISDNNADDYIKLMGHKDLQEIYKAYYGYVSASQSEGFGLTLMEAVGSGLPIVGFDVPYGNQTFIDDAANGFLLPFSTNSEESIAYLADGIEQLVDNSRQDSFKNTSYQKAEFFLEKNNQYLWEKLVKEVTHD
ncbi:accessory Sec system glycosyltransferase GtfA [Leuconostoc sp. MS02]|uniref:Accessory Sec system glycosyltransferase GtfA n=1 Tax=Leuconostoc aquikimchii TaxID=3236804 RepID=A0ABV3S6Z1_9LACO